MTGEVYIEKGDYPKGLKYNEEYLHRSRDLQDAALEQRALANLGWTYYTMAITDKKKFSQALGSGGGPLYHLQSSSSTERIP